MAGDRLLRILARLTSGSAIEPEAARLCEVCADVSLMTGAGIMLITGDTNQGSVCSSNSVSALIEELQFTLGEGPCVDAHRLDLPVVEADLADPDMPRWLGFAPPAVAAGARAVFGFPMRVGGARLGDVLLLVAQLDMERNRQADWLARRAAARRRGEPLVYDNADAAE